MRRLFGPERIVRLYPRAWRERYEDEMRALLEEMPSSAAVRWDLVRGLGCEWARALTFGLADRLRSEGVRISGRLFRRMAVGATVGYGVAVAAWSLGSEVHAAGHGLTRLSFVHEFISIVCWFRALVAQSVIALGGPRWLLVRKPEAVAWGAVLFFALLHHRLEALYIANQGWNLASMRWTAFWTGSAALFSWLALSTPGANELQRRRRALSSARSTLPVSDGHTS